MKAMEFRYVIKNEEGEILYIEDPFDVYLTLDGELYTVDNDKLNAEVIQWTGLFDINNKKIFEGDIIKYHRHVGSYYKGEVINKIGVVIWEDDKCSFRIKHNGGDTEKLFTSHRIEVIGNIYENPKLI
jgi:uncharacterized phage protein (TIGR01671 family)